MDKTNGNNTPGGSPVLENPPSAEAGPTDSGEGQLLLVDAPFKRSTTTPRTPTKKKRTRIKKMQNLKKGMHSNLKTYTAGLDHTHLVVPRAVPPTVSMTPMSLP